MVNELRLIGIIICLTGVSWSAQAQPNETLRRRSGSRMDTASTVMESSTALPFGDPNQDQEIDNTGFAIEYRFRSQDRSADPEC